MRKYFSALALLAVLSFSVFADGQIGASKDCPVNQLCVAGQIGASRNSADHLTPQSASVEFAESEQSAAETSPAETFIDSVGNLMSGMLAALHL